MTGAIRTLVADQLFEDLDRGYRARLLGEVGADVRGAQDRVRLGLGHADLLGELGVPPALAATPSSESGGRAQGQRSQAFISNRPIDEAMANINDVLALDGVPLIAAVDNSLLHNATVTAAFAEAFALSEDRYDPAEAFARERGEPAMRSAEDDGLTTTHASYCILLNRFRQDDLTRAYYA